MDGPQTQDASCEGRIAFGKCLERRVAFIQCKGTRVDRGGKRRALTWRWKEKEPLLMRQKKKTVVLRKGLFQIRVNKGRNAAATKRWNTTKLGDRAVHWDWRSCVGEVYFSWRGDHLPVWKKKEGKTSKQPFTKRKKGS